MKLKTRELVLAALLAALLIAAKQAMSFIPNFEPVTLLLILYTLHFPRMTPLIIYVFVTVQVLLYGFNVWVYMYLYIWIILYAVVRLLARWGSYPLWIIVAALAVISVLVVYSSTAKMAYDAHTARTTAHFLRQQLIILVVSLIILVAVQKINCRIYNLLSRPVYFLSVALTVAVYFIGATTNGAARWIPLGPFQFQPSEALKVATVLFLARQLAGRQSKIDKIRIVPSLKFWTWRSSREQRRIWREGTWPILMPVVVSCAVIFPAHTSSAVLVFMASWVMMLIGRVRLGELVKLIGLACIGIHQVIGREQRERLAQRMNDKEEY